MAILSSAKIQIIDGKDAIVSTSAPYPPVYGQLWVDMSDPASPIIRVWDGTDWILSFIDLDSYDQIQDTWNYRQTDAPTNNASFLDITSVPSTNGQIMVQVQFEYTQGSLPADIIYLYNRAVTGDGPWTLTESDTCLPSNLPTGVTNFQSSFVLFLLPETKYIFGLQVAKASTNGMSHGIIVQNAQPTTTGLASLNLIPISSIAGWANVEESGVVTIDGGKLKADSIETAALKANSVLAGNIDVVNLAAIKAEMGDLTAGTITLNSYTVSGESFNGHIKCGQTGYNSGGDGFWFGIDNGTPKLSIGDTENNGLIWDGTDLKIGGGVTIGDTLASSVLNSILDMSSDNKLTPIEKQAAKKEWDIIVAEKQNIIDQAAIFRISSVAYSNAYDSLNYYLNSVPPSGSALLGNLEETSTIVGSEFRSKWKDYDTEKTYLLNAITGCQPLVFDSFFENELQWGNVQGSMQFIASAITGSSGGKVLRVTGQSTVLSKDYLPVDITRNYLSRCRARQVSGTGVIHAGFACYNKTKQYIATVPAGGTYNYSAFLNKTLSSNWEVGEGIIVTPTVDTDDPLHFREGTAYVRLVALCNWGGTGVCELDALEFVDVTEAYNAKTTADTAIINAANATNETFSGAYADIGNITTMIEGDVYLCSDLTGAYAGALFVYTGSEWVTAADKTQVVIDGGVASAGRFEVGTAGFNSCNAGISGAVTVTPDTDIRFWAGSTWGNSSTANFRVQNDGTLYATNANISGSIDGSKITGSTISTTNKMSTLSNVYNNGDSIAYLEDASNFSSAGVGFLISDDCSYTRILWTYKTSTSLNGVVAVNIDGGIITGNTHSAGSLVVENTKAIVQSESGNYIAMLDGNSEITIMINPSPLAVSANEDTFFSISSTTLDKYYISGESINIENNYSEGNLAGVNILLRQKGDSNIGNATGINIYTNKLDSGQMNYSKGISIFSSGAYNNIGVDLISGSAYEEIGIGIKSLASALTTSKGIEASATGELGVTAYGVYSSGFTWDFYAVGDTHSTGYGPFTGGHDALILKNEIADIQQGDILYDKKIIHHSGISNTIAEVSRTILEKEKSVIGIFVSSRKFNQDSIPRGLKTIDVNNMPDYNLLEELYYSCTLNAVGEGQINVCKDGGNIEAGDYICSSSRPGKGMKQDDDLLHNYTVAKAREDCVWLEGEDDIRMIACTYHCG